MKNLSKEGDAKERELEKIGKEYATLTFVRSIANNKVDWWKIIISYVEQIILILVNSLALIKLKR